MSQDLFNSLSKFAKRSEADHLGLMRCHSKWFEHMCEAGFNEVKAALEGWLRSSVAALAGSAAKLEAGIVPDWEEYTVTQFNVELVKEKVLSTDWSSFATRWQSINVSHSLVENLTSPECASFKSMTGAQDLSKRIAKLKAWIVAVSLCSFIIEELPCVAVKDRKDSICSFIANLKDAKDPPANLVRYLDQELKKCKK